MNENGHKTYGEDAELVGMKKMCKSCYEKVANDKGVNSSTIEFKEYMCCIVTAFILQ